MSGNGGERRSARTNKGITKRDRDFTNLEDYQTESEKPPEPSLPKRARSKEGKANDRSSQRIHLPGGTNFVSHVKSRSKSKDHTDGGNFGILSNEADAYSQESVSDDGSSAFSDDNAKNSTKSHQRTQPTNGDTSDNNEHSHTELGLSVIERGLKRHFQNRSSHELSQKHPHRSDRRRRGTERANPNASQKSIEKERHMHRRPVRKEDMQNQSQEDSSHVNKGQDDMRSSNHGIRSDKKAIYVHYPDWKKSRQKMQRYLEEEDDDDDESNDELGNAQTQQESPQLLADENTIDTDDGDDGNSKDIIKEATLGPRRQIVHNKHRRMRDTVSVSQNQNLESSPLSDDDDMTRPTETTYAKATAITKTIEACVRDNIFCFVKFPSGSSIMDPFSRVAKKCYKLFDIAEDDQPSWWNLHKNHVGSAIRQKRNQVKQQITKRIIEKCSGDFPDLDDILLLRHNADVWKKWVQWLMPITCGSKRWRSNVTVCRLSKFATVSDEAFTLLIIESEIEKCKYKAKLEQGSAGNDGESIPAPKYTTGTTNKKERDGQTWESSDTTYSTKWYSKTGTLTSPARLRISLFMI